MKDAIENAREELKRIDHLIYVTLKYTRTVDVFLSVIERMINAYEFIVDALVKKLMHERKLVEDAESPLVKAQALLEHYDSKMVKDNIEKYLLLRKLRRASYEKSNEFRRHVTMTALVDGKTVIVNIDTVTEDFHKLKDFLEQIEKKF